MDQGAAIRTDRLILRALVPADAEPIARGIGAWDVIRWLTTPPWPYALADARAFLAGPASAGAWGIEVQGALAGIVSLEPRPPEPQPESHPELGYWLALPYHGRGLMTEAAGALLDRHFRHGGDVVVSGHLLGNAASARVLAKLGFRPTFCRTTLSRPQGQDVEVQRKALTAADWLAGR